MSSRLVSVISTPVSKAVPVYQEMGLPYDSEHFPRVHPVIVVSLRGSVTCLASAARHRVIRRLPPPFGSQSPCSSQYRVFSLFTYQRMTVNMSIHRSNGCLRPGGAGRKWIEAGFRDVPNFVRSFSLLLHISRTSGMPWFVPIGCLMHIQYRVWASSHLVPSLLTVGRRIGTNLYLQT